MGSTTAISIMFLRINYGPVELVFLMMMRLLVITGFAELLGFIRFMIEEIQVRYVVGSSIDSHKIEVKDNWSWKYAPDNLY